MAQATILAAGNTAATSTDIVVAAGESVTVGIFAASAAQVPTDAAFIVEQDTPGADNIVARLGQQQRATVLAGPGTYRVSRAAYTGTAFGVFTES